MTGPSFWSQFELRQLRCFVAAAEELHFGRAAARMNMTQPPLSRQIQLLEHVLGVKLLDRTSRAVKLTPAGRVFLLEARRILRLTESAALATRRIASGEAGTIALGFTAAQDFEGDQFTFTKFPLEDLETLFGLKATELAPASAGNFDTLAEVCFQRGDKDKALAAEKKAIELDPNKAYFRKQVQRFEAGDPAAERPPESEDDE